MHLRRPRAVSAAALAVAPVSAVDSPAASVATAAPAGNVVVFGDSYAANPDQIRNVMRKIPGASAAAYENYPSTGG